jgi:hypothetical protein
MLSKRSRRTIHPDMLTPEIAVDAEIDLLISLNPNPETI